MLPELHCQYKESGDITDVSLLAVYNHSVLAHLVITIILSSVSLTQLHQGLAYL